MKRKLVALLMAAVLVTSSLLIVGCGSNEPAATPTPAATPAPPVAATPTPTPEATPEPEVVRDLGGMQIVIGNWWGYYDTDTFEPTTAQAEARLEDRIYVEQRYNFRVREVRMGGWGEVRDMIPVELAAGSRDVHVWIMQPDWFATVNANNLLAPIPMQYFTSESVRTDWMFGAIDGTMRGGDAHGWATGVMEGGGVYFNMRLLEEAGIDPELPFDLQMRGEWTWDAFLDLLHQTTRDVDGDGIPDTWGMATFSSDLLERTLASNRAMYIGQDAYGRFTNETITPEFLQALSWANDLQDQGVLQPQPEGSEWNFFIDSFNNAEVAFRVAGGYVAGAQINPNLDDPWGFVHFPIGPNSNRPYFMGNANLNAIPVSFTAEEVSDIMFAINQWGRPLPDFDDPDAWMAGAFTAHYHPRSVEETMALFTRNPDNHVAALHGLVPGGLPTRIGPLFAWRLWNDNESAAIVEEAQPEWLEYLARGNGEID